MAGRDDKALDKLQLLARCQLGAFVRRTKLPHPIGCGRETVSHPQRPNGGGSERQTQPKSQNDAEPGYVRAAPISYCRITTSGSIKQEKHGLFTLKQPDLPTRFR